MRSGLQGWATPRLPPPRSACSSVMRMTANFVFIAGDAAQSKAVPFLHELPPAPNGHVTRVSSSSKDYRDVRIFQTNE